MEATTSENREMLDKRLSALSEEKRLRKMQASQSPTPNPTATIDLSRRIVETVRQIRALPEEECCLTRSQRGTLHWAHYDLAVHSPDATERLTYAKYFLEKLLSRTKANAELENVDRQALVTIGWMLGKRVWQPDFAESEVLPTIACLDLLVSDIKSLWPAETVDPRRICFRGLTRRFRQMTKAHSRDGVGSATSNCYINLCEHMLPFLDAKDFERPPATPEAIRKSKGKIQTFSSTFETAMTLCNHGFKTYRSWNDGIEPSDVLIDFLRAHTACGKWLGLYCGIWLFLRNRAMEASEYFRKVVCSNRAAAWAWLYLARTYEPKDENGIRCLARALLCPSHSPIQVYTANKIHNELARRLMALGDVAHATAERAIVQNHTCPPEALAFYRAKAIGSDSLAAAFSTSTSASTNRLSAKAS